MLKASCNLKDMLEYIPIVIELLPKDDLMKRLKVHSKNTRVDPEKGPLGPPFQY